MPEIASPNSNTTRDGTSVRPFKGIICDDVSEFESHMPSQAVRSLCAIRGQKIPFGDPIQGAEKIDWICNLFAVPLAESAARRWASVLKQCMQ